MPSITTVNSTSGLLRLVRQLKAILSPLGFIEERQKKYGDFYQIVFKDAPPTVVASNPKAIADIFTAPDDSFEVGKTNKGLNFLVGDNSLLLLDGKTHKNRRRLLMPSFHGESLEKCSEEIVSITEQVISQWQINHPFKIRPFMQEITLKVILSVVFGVNSGAKAERLRILLTQLLETFNNPFNSLLIFFPALQKDWGKFSPWGRFLRVKQEIRELLYQQITSQRNLIASENSQPTDILSLLIQAQDENGQGLSDEELHDELITLLFAGHETTASALSWVFYWINFLPEVGEKLVSEIADLGENPDYKQINNLPYLDAVIAETLRIYPIATGSFARVLTKPMSIMGYDFAPKTWFMISIYGLHHREDLYPNSYQFQPDRFLNKKYSNYEYIPFGGGNRRCLGSALALLEMKLVIVTILSHFQLALTTKKAIAPVRRGLTVAPPASLQMKVIGKR